MARGRGSGMGQDHDLATGDDTTDDWAYHVHKDMRSADVRQAHLLACGHCGCAAAGAA